MKKFLPFDLANIRAVGTHYPFPLYWLILFYLVSVYTALGTRLSILEAIRHELLIGVVLIGVSIWVLSVKPLKGGDWSILLVAIVMFFVAVLLAVPFAYDNGHAWDVFFNHVLKPSMLALFLSALVRTPRHVGLLVGFFLFSLFWLYQESVRGLITGELYWYNQGIQRLHGSVDQYRSPNSLSAIAVTSLPFLRYIGQVVTQRKHKIMMTITFLLAVTCIIFTGSRAGYVVSLILGFAWWLSSKSKWKSLAVGIVVVLLVLVFLPQQYVGRFSTIGHQEETDNSRAERIDLLHDAWRVFQENPLGVGVDCFIWVNGPETGRYVRCHNLYLQVASDLGVGGLLAFFFLVGALFHSHRGIIRSVKDQTRMLRKIHGLARDDQQTVRRLYSLHKDLGLLDATAKAFRLYLLVVLVQGMFGHIMYKPSWWLMAGTAVGLNNALSYTEGRIRILGSQVMNSNRAPETIAGRG